MTDFDAGEPPTTAEPTQTPAGWYPTDPGWQQYWDGANWTEHRTPVAASSQMAPMPTASDETSIAVLAHLGGLFAGFIVPLVIYLIKKDESPFLRHHAAEALNFQISLMIGYTIAIFLILVLVGLLLLPLLAIAHLVFSIMAAIAANKGEYYKYPLNLRLIT